MKYHILKVWLIAMLLLSGCSSDKEQVEYMALNVDNLWQGSVPVKYENIGIDCQKGETDVLIPELITSEEPLQVVLYGCWQLDLITCDQGIFKEAKINRDGINRVVISLWKEGLPSNDCPADEPQFRKQHTYDINGSWQSGEIEVVIQNLDSNLSGYVIVE
ncbi:MAG: hypothetical protein K0U47_01535 [Epsilonproteobacteria bacterium]|nr:hypothetical protein [Campylobacterota bacterium]